MRALRMIGGLTIGFLCAAGIVWAHYPPWYHAVYLASLLPTTWLGGRLVPSPARELAGPVIH